MASPYFDRNRGGDIGDPGFPERKPEPIPLGFCPKGHGKLVRSGQLLACATCDHTEAPARFDAPEKF